MKGEVIRPFSGSDKMIASGKTAESVRIRREWWTKAETE
jgi:hypothetical protein